VVAACRAAGVSASAFYAWTARREQEPRVAESAQAELVAKIRTIPAESGDTYGSPRVTAELRRRGWMVNHKRVERLMATHGIVGHRPRRRRGLTKPNTAAPPAPDLVGRLFAPDQPDRIWVSDLTYIPPTRGGCTWPALLIWPRGTCSAGRWANITTLAWSVTPWTRPSPPAVVAG
jgi:putative transposase